MPNPEFWLSTSRTGFAVICIFATASRTATGEALWPFKKATLFK